MLPIIGVLLLTASSPQSVPTPRLPPALLVRTAEEASSQPLSIERMDVQVSATAFLAETTTTIIFRNDNARALEGELVFPLPEGATLSGYALDVEGVLIDGVVVEQQKARIVFEQEVRKGIDPGLAEWVKGSNFRTRIWPIPARGTRTVRVRYLSALSVRGSGTGLEATYVLPMVRQKISLFSLRIEVAKTQVTPEIRSGGLANFHFGPWEERYVAETRLVDFEAREDLTVALPAVPRQNVTVERGADGGAYFTLDAFPVGAQVAAEARPAKKAGLYWDASMSREAADRRAEMRAIELWLRRIGDIELEVVVFRNVADPLRAFSIRGGNAIALLAFLEAAPRDGGTDLGSLVFNSDHDYDVVVTDGLDNLTNRLPESKRALYILNGDARADHAVLRHLSRISGGTYLNLQSSSADEAARAIGSASAPLLSIDHDPRQIADLAPQGSALNTGRVSLTGRLLVPEATITLRYGSGSSSPSETFVIRQEGARAGRLTPTFWAQQRVAELSVFPDRNRAELLALGRSFGIVTPGASLLVLETLEQHLTHRIEPPATRPAMRSEYLERRASADEAETNTRRSKLDSVVKMWNERVAWWKKSFPHHAGFRVKGSRGRGGVEGGVAGGVAGGIVGGLPAEPPAMAAPVRVGGNIATNETVTVEAAEAPSVQASMARASRMTTSDADSSSIVLKAWNPDTPYLRAIRQAGPRDSYAEFLRQRITHGDAPSFYLDSADYFLETKQRPLALRVLSDVAELRLEDPRLLRIVAHRLQQLGEFDLAIVLFESVLRLRPDEPQSLRDLAGVLTDRADRRSESRPIERTAALSDYERALDLLNRVILGAWDSRFEEIELFAIEESNRILARLARDGGAGEIKAAIGMDPRFRQNLETDLRIVLTWDTNDTDMDIWVVEPSGEQAMYSAPLTAIGGIVSNDFTEGYGPEEYQIRAAMPGVYRIKANYYGARTATLIGPTTVQATIFTDFGRANEKRRSITLRLKTAKEEVDIGEVQIGPGAVRPKRPSR